jgi:hypothetical protein
MAISTSLASRLVSAQPSDARGAIISLTGMQGTGKTGFALSAVTAGTFSQKHKPVYIPMDRKPVGKYISDLLASGRVMIPKTNFKANIKTAKQTEGAKLWDEFEKLNEDIIAEPSLNPIIWDTGTYAWAMCRLAKLGKLTQIMPHQYAQANTPYEALLLQAEDAGKIIIVIDRMSPEYKQGKDGKEAKTGNYERSGYSHLGFVANILLESFLTESNEFGMRVIQNKITPSQSGEECVGEPACCFGYLLWKTFGEPEGEGIEEYIG